ncbi:MAG TPA: hypothetical protein VJ251_07575, partial [Stellaceae bacterium]|nr:hypothetical protein [Stellaceae bacterium]
MSEQQAEQTSGETGSLSAGSSDTQSSATQSEPVAAAAPEISVVESPMIAPDEVPEFTVEAPKVEAPKVEMNKPEVPRLGKLMIMAPGERSFGNEHASGPKAEQVSPTPGEPGKRRFAAVAAMVALAIIAGALGGALATAGIGHFIVAAEETSPANGAFEASIARIDADILALKADVEHTSKTGVSQFNKTSDRLDRLEKAQAEPGAKLAKLSEAVDKLRTAPAAVAAAPIVPKDVTGSIAPPQVAAAQAAPAPAAAAPKTEVGRLPTV